MKSSTPSNLSRERLPKKTVSKSLPPELTPSVLFEDKNVVVINKPAGLMVHPDAKSTEATLCDWVIECYPALQGVGEPSRASDGTTIDRPGIVHRLDKDTSGVLVLAKTQESFEFLKKSFQTRNVQKTYNTFVWGLFKDNSGVIERPIGRSKSDFRKWSAERYARGELRPATTEYKVLDGKTFSTPESVEMPIDQVKDFKKQNVTLSFSYVEAFPKTGRTHQIRVHFKAVNHPVVGDPLYAPNHPSTLGFKRLALHSRSISFAGVDGKQVTVEAPLPDDFKQALELFSK